MSPQPHAAGDGLPGAVSTVTCDDWPVDRTADRMAGDLPKGNGAPERRASPAARRSAPTRRLGGRCGGSGWNTPYGPRDGPSGGGRMLRQGQTSCVAASPFPVPSLSPDSYMAVFCVPLLRSPPLCLPHCLPGPLLPSHRCIYFTPHHLPPNCPTLGSLPLSPGTLCRNLSRLEQNRSGCSMATKDFISWR